METYIEKKTSPTSHVHKLKFYGDCVKATNEQKLHLLGKPQKNEPFAMSYPNMQIVEDNGEWLTQAPFELKIQKQNKMLLIYTTTSEWSWRVREVLKNMIREYEKDKTTKLFNN